MPRSLIKRRGMRPAALAFGVALAMLPIRAAMAVEFTDRCVEGGGGMFSKPECDCLDNTIDDDEREVLLVLFTASLKSNQSGKPLDDSSPEFQKGMTVLNKYTQKCANK
jgi:hypothetical protein